MKKIKIPTENLTEEEIKKDIEGKEELNEERLVGTQDEGDDDPADTTPVEAEELIDEGEKLLEEERKRREHPGDWD